MKNNKNNKKISELELNLINKNKIINDLKLINENLLKSNKELNNRCDYKFNNAFDLKNDNLKIIEKICNSSNEEIKKQLIEYNDFNNLCVDEIFKRDKMLYDITNKYNSKLYDYNDTYNKLIEIPINTFLDDTINLIIENNNIYKKNLIKNVLLKNLNEDFEKIKKNNKLKLKYNNLVDDNFHIIENEIKKKFYNIKPNLKENLKKKLDEIFIKFDNINFKNNIDLLHKFKYKSISLDRKKNIININNISYKYLEKPNYLEIPGNDFLFDNFDNLHFYYYKKDNSKNINFEKNKWVNITDNNIINFDSNYYIKVVENSNYLIIDNLVNNEIKFNDNIDDNNIFLKKKMEEINSNKNKIFKFNTNIFIFFIVISLIYISILIYSDYLYKDNEMKVLETFKMFITIILNMYNIFITYSFKNEQTLLCNDYCQINKKKILPKFIEEKLKKVFKKNKMSSFEHLFILNLVFIILFSIPLILLKFKIKINLFDYFQKISLILIFYGVCLKTISLLY